MTNTALAHYALGHLDESLRLYDRAALAFTEKVRFPRDEAYCLYGVGVNYYALGDRQRARQFLERSLAIRTVALDGRGAWPVGALATIDAEQGRVEQALASDREALALAIAPSAIARIKIQQAAHTATAGHPTDAKALLDEVPSSGGKAGPLIQAEALLQRAVLLRSMGRPHEALADLAAARPRSHAFGSVMKSSRGARARPGIAAVWTP